MDGNNVLYTIIDMVNFIKYVSANSNDIAKLSQWPGYWGIRRYLNTL